MGNKRHSFPRKRSEGYRTHTDLKYAGQKVFEKIIEVKTPGIITEEISRNNFPSSGLYIIKAGETLYLTKKIVIE